MSKRSLTCVLLLLLFITLTATACVDVGGSTGGGTSAAANSTPIPQYYIQSTQSADATATHAAGEFYLQLTAIAEEKEKNKP